MTTPTIQQISADLRNLLEKATPGEWKSDHEVHGPGDVSIWANNAFLANIATPHDCEPEGANISSDWQNIHDAKLIVAMKNYLPDILSCIKDCVLEFERLDGVSLCERHNASMFAAENIKLKAEITRKDEALQTAIHGLKHFMGLYPHKVSFGDHQMFEHVKAALAPAVEVPNDERA